VIENYESPDEGWGVVIGPFVRLTPEQADDERNADAPAAEDTSSGPRQK
jgi:hypothetical protein